MILFLLIQASAPDLELGIHAHARSVTIEQKGDARLTVRTAPDGGNLVDVQAPRLEGRKKLNNVDVSIRAEGRIAATSSPEPRETPQHH